MKYNNKPRFDLSAITSGYDFVRADEKSPMVAVPKDQSNVVIDNFSGMQEIENPLALERSHYWAVQGDQKGLFLMKMFLESENLDFSPKNTSHYSLEQISLDYEGKPSIIFDKIDNLLENDDYDEEFLAPTEFAANQMKALISDIYRIFGNSIDFAKFLPNGKGGIEAIFRKGSRVLHLVSPNAENKKPYLFHKEEFIHNIVKITNPQILIFWTKWLLEA